MRGVRGRRSGVGGGGVDVIDGNAAEDGPAPPFCLELGLELELDEDEAEATGSPTDVDCSLSCDMRLLRALLGVPLCEAVLDPLRREECRVALGCRVSVFVEFCPEAAIQLFSSARSDEVTVFGGKRDKLSGTPALRFSAAKVQFKCQWWRMREKRLSRLPCSSVGDVGDEREGGIGREGE